MEKIMRNFCNISITTAVLGLVILGFIWSDLLWKVHEHQQIVINEAVKNTGNLARAFEEHTLRTLKNADQLALFLKYQYEKKGRTLDLAPFKKEGLLGKDPFVLCSIADENGDVVLSNQEPFIPVNIKDREHFQIHVAADNGQLFIGKPVYGRASEKWSIPLTRRINKPDGSFGGVVVVSVDPFYFTGFYKQVDLGKHSAIALVGQDGVIRVRQSDGQATIGLALQKDMAAYQWLFTKATGCYIGKSPMDDVARIYSFRRLQEYPLIVVVGMAEEKALAEFYIWRNNYYEMAALLSLLIVAAFAMILRMLWGRQRAEQLNRVLYEISETASSAPNLEELYKEMHGIVGKLIPAKNFSIALYEEQKGLYFPYYVVASAEPDNKVRMAGLAKYVIDTGKPLLTGPYDAPKMAIRNGYWLGVPLKASNDVTFGVMAVFTRAEGTRYTEKDQQILSFLSHQAAMVIKRKQAETALWESRERFEAFVKQSSEIVAVYDPYTLQIVEVNVACMAVFGYSEQELLSMVITDINVMGIESMQEIVATVLREGSLSHSAFCQHKNGGRLHIECVSSLIQFKNKRLILVTGRDITVERKLQEKIQHEVELAGAVQRAMVPSDYDDPRIDIRAIYQSVHLVNGDFYGFEWSEDGCYLHGYVLDVAGHGMAAALQTSAISALLNREIRRGLTAQTLKRLNPQLMSYFSEGFYAAIIAFTIDFPNRALTCVSGGINKFLAFSQKSISEVTIPGSYLGLMDEPEFETLTMPIGRDDTFYFMTDGIYERLTQEVIGKASDFPGTIAALQEMATDFSRLDDCSAVCIRIKGFSPFPLHFSNLDQTDWQNLRPQLVKILQEQASSEAAKVVTALGEAVTNGLQHGAKVRIKINKAGHRLILRVKDNGAGFDGTGAVAAIVRAGAENVLAQYLLAEHGRGIPIMVAWMDKVVYGRHGNEVLLMKRV